MKWALLWTVPGALALVLHAPSALADADRNLAAAEQDLAGIVSEIPMVRQAVERSHRERPSPEQRLANGELLFRAKDYPRAILVLSQIVEEAPNTPVLPDAISLRAETFYAAQEYLSARRDFRALVDRSTDPRFASFQGKALARLVDISLRLDEPPEALAEIYERMERITDPDPALRYAKGKARFRRREWTAAVESFASVPLGTLYTHQARYFEGLVAMRLARASQPAPDPSRKEPTSANYKQTIETFVKVTQLAPDSTEHKHVIDLAWLAIGRLFYEMEQYDQARAAYEHVTRDSEEFDVMLYELAWVYVRVGDVKRAERALEVLAVSDPSSPDIGDGTLLRADLLLRAGTFAKSLVLYEGVRSQYSPTVERVEKFLDATRDVSVYYEKLSQQQLDVLDQSEQLPALALRWAREAQDGPTAFAVIDDINQCRTLIAQAQDMIARLTAMATATSRVHAFPELELGQETALGLINRISRARAVLARALDDEEPRNLEGEIAAVRERRRSAMGAVQTLPMGQADFAERSVIGARQWNGVSQELSRRSLEVDQVQANVNGLRRMLRDDAQRGVARDPGRTQRFQQELDANERDLKKYREQIAELRRTIEMGRAQIGLGDSRFQNDAAARLTFRDALDREVVLARQGQAGRSAQSLADRAEPILRQARANEDQLVDAFNTLEQQVQARSTELLAKVRTEQANLARYQARLDALDAEARDLVGHVAQRNFAIVRDKLRNIVLRADVGITEQAWEVREEELERVRVLQTERARQELRLDEELKEVRDDGIEPAARGTGK
ncbi:MAG: tetratricopeptide repeat protein [Myxococcales bacterium]